MKVFVIMLMLLWCGAVTAETAQVMTGAPAKLLGGEGESYRTLRILPTSSEIEVIKVGQEYTKVKTMDGQIGWIKSSLLQPKQMAADMGNSAEPVLEAVQRDLLATRGQLAKMESELAQARIEGKPQLVSLFSVSLAPFYWALIALASFVAGMVVGALLLRAYYIKRLHGLRI